MRKLWFGQQGGRSAWGRPGAAAVLAAAFAFVFLAGAPEQAWSAEAGQAGEELVHLDFEDGSTGGFSIYTNGGSCEIANADGQLEVSIEKCGSLDYANQVYWDGFSLTEGCAYTYSFDLSSDIARQVEYRLQLNGGDYHAYEGAFAWAGPEMTHYSVDFVMEETTDPAPRIVFNMGKMSDMAEDPGPHRVLIDNISLVLTDDSNAVTESEEEASAVSVNQAGYRPEDEKTVFVHTDAAEGTFVVKRSPSGLPVMQGTLDGPIADEATGFSVARGDFSEVRQPGTYYIHVSAGGLEEDSPRFVIGEDVYAKAFPQIFRMLTLQRCGTAPDEELAGAWAHGVCHTGDAVIYGSGETREVSGGWHDAGDYGRYVVSGVKAAADLMLACGEFGADSDELRIPESGNGVPDLLDEARWELDWLLKMQDAETGGVWHKVTCAAFPGEVMPEEETDQLILAPVSVAATGDFAAIMAKASRVYRPYDPAFADAALEAARSAWDYISRTDAGAGFVNPPEISTGEYPDSNTTDEVFWAAAELFLAGEEGMETSLSRGVLTALAPGLGWADMGGYAMYDLACCDAETPEDIGALCAQILQNEAEKIADRIEGDGYFASLGTEYPWGSNMAAADNGVLLLMAAKLSPAGNGGEDAETAAEEIETETAVGSDEAEQQTLLGPDVFYLALARRQLDYLFGANGPGICYVSGLGAVSPENPHHRPSQAAGAAMPGMLAGGPNGNLEDPYAQSVLAGLAPALCYADNAQSYSTNEVAVYWNSPLICLMAPFIG